MRFRYYIDNGEVTRISIMEPQAEVDAFVRQEEESSADEELAAKMISMDAALAAEPQSETADELYEVRRDAGIKIAAQQETICRLSLVAAVGWLLAFWLVIAWLVAKVLS